MTKLARTAVLAAGLVCGCILPVSAAEAEEEARVLQYRVIQPGQTDRITVESAADAVHSVTTARADGVLTVDVDGEEYRAKADESPSPPCRMYDSIQ